MTKETNGTQVQYQLEVDDDSDFASPEIDTLPLTSAGFTSSGVLVADSTYYWRVRPYDLAGNSPGFTDSQRLYTARDYVCGDADGNGIVNMSDIVYIMAYIFGGGDPPDPLLSGDADCNRVVNISDVVYLQNYIFHSGPAPCAACS